MSLYTVRKIKDLTTGKDCDDLKLSGRKAIAKIPHPEALVALHSGVTMYKGPLWLAQEILDPPIGYRMFFTVNNTNSEWYVTSRIVSCETKDSGDVILTTDNSIYLCEIKK